MNINKNISIININGGLNASLPFFHEASAKYDNIMDVISKQDFALGKKNVLHFLGKYKDLLDKVIPEKNYSNKSNMIPKLTNLISNNEKEIISKKQELNLSNKNRNDFGI